MIGRAPVFEERLLPLLRLAARPQGVIPRGESEEHDADVLVSVGAAQWLRRAGIGPVRPVFALHATVPGLVSLLDAQIGEAAGLADLVANNPAVAADDYFRRLQNVLRRRPA